LNPSPAAPAPARAQVRAARFVKSQSKATGADLHLIRLLGEGDAPLMTCLLDTDGGAGARGAAVAAWERLRAARGDVVDVRQ
jgi:hypothetical protein